jgi:hypothetical protein
MSQLRLSARVDRLRAARIFPVLSGGNGLHASSLMVPHGCSTICWRLCITAGSASTRGCIHSRMCSWTPRVIRRSSLCRIPRTCSAPARHAAVATGVDATRQMILGKVTSKTAGKSMCWVRDAPSMRPMACLPQIDRDIISAILIRSVSIFPGSRASKAWRLLKGWCLIMMPAGIWLELILTTLVKKSSSKSSFSVSFQPPFAQMLPNE